MEDLPWTSEEQKERLLLIGSVCAQWSHLEHLFSGTIWTLLKLDDETGKIVTGGLDMLRRARMAINLARHLKASRSLIKALLAARDAIQNKLDEKRNRVVHGFQILSLDAKQLQIEVHRGKGDRKKHELTAAELYKLNDDIHDVSATLLIVLRRTIWTNWRAKHGASHEIYLKRTGQA